MLCSQAIWRRLDAAGHLLCPVGPARPLKGSETRPGHHSAHPLHRLHHRTPATLGRALRTTWRSQQANNGPVRPCRDGGGGPIRCVTSRCNIAMVAGLRERPRRAYLTPTCRGCQWRAWPLGRPPTPHWRAGRPEHRARAPAPLTAGRRHNNSLAVGSDRAAAAVAAAWSSPRRRATKRSCQAHQCGGVHRCEACEGVGGCAWA